MKGEHNMYNNDFLRFVKEILVDEISFAVQDEDYRLARHELALLETGNFDGELTEILKRYEDMYIDFAH